MSANTRVQLAAGCEFNLYYCTSLQLLPVLSSDHHKMALAPNQQQEGADSVPVTSHVITCSEHLRIDLWTVTRLLAGAAVNMLGSYIAVLA